MSNFAGPLSTTKESNVKVNGELKEVISVWVNQKLSSLKNIIEFSIESGVFCMSAYVIDYENFNSKFDLLSNSASYLS